MAQPTILVVDDNPLNRELAGDLLTMDALDVQLIDSGEKSLRAAHEYHPDLILMDMRMPGMSGLEAMQELRKSPGTRDIPVVVLTASVMAGERERLLAEGFDGFMQKPIDVASFASEVRSFLK